MNTLTKTLFLIIGLAVLGGLAYLFITMFNVQDPFVGSIINVEDKKEHTSGIPMQLTIPSIDVDAPIQSLGLAKDGSVDVPKGPSEAAWFNVGPRPGEKGSSVITGHYGPWLNGAQSVFNNLNKLKPGDKVQVKDPTGKIFTFVVKSAKTYKADDKPPEVFNSTDGKVHLNLITCQGDWLRNERTFTERLVVFTDLEK